MPLDRIRIATRQSPLALWQAEFVRDQLRGHHPGLAIELVPMSTRGDQLLDRSLAKIGGKGLFLKELEEAMAAGNAELAVHSMKDVPADLPAGFTIAAILERHNPQDALVSNRHPRFADLPQGARVGTSSLRRQAQLLAHRPDLVVEPLRGNVNTRLAKLDEGQHDAIILAAAGLERLGMGERIAEVLSPEVSLPAVAQGAMGIECLTEREDVRELVAVLDHAPTRCRVEAERAMSLELGGSCQVPLAGYCVFDDDRLWLRALLGRPDGSQLLRAEARAVPGEPGSLGRSVADDLLRQGAAAIMEAL